MEHGSNYVFLREAADFPAICFDFQMLCEFPSTSVFPSFPAQ